MRRLIRLASVAALLAMQGLVPGTAAAHPTATATQNCSLDNGIQHVISITFDNTHLFRDRAGVPSDLEQMPNLLNFMTGNGTLTDNNHTILISHTAGGILTSLTGLYPDRQGLTVTNSYGYFKPDGSTGFSTAFKYWTDKVDDVTADGVNDPLPNMVTTGGLNTPAPWVPYTRAGCDYGAVSTANVVVENTKITPAGDMTRVFGKDSAEWIEARDHAALAQTDFVGIAIHCAQGGGICNTSSHAKADVLPDEPGGYNGFNGLFGAKYVNPAITGGNAAVKDTENNNIKDPAGNPGFPGFDGMYARVSLGYVAQMQEAGVPVTFAYISDAHDNHTAFRASGPGEADYVAQLHSYDQAFGAFFARLAADGINKSNTLFVFTSDENDHFAGGSSTNGTWSHTYCNISAGQTCPANQIGEVEQNLNELLPTGYTPPAYDAHFDSAPTIYVSKTGTPPTTSDIRRLERNLASANAIDPYVNPAPTPVMLWIADRVGEKAPHMVNADPRRTPDFTYFANPDYFLTTTNTRAWCQAPRTHERNVGGPRRHPSDDARATRADGQLRARRRGAGRLPRDLGGLARPSGAPRVAGAAARRLQGDRCAVRTLRPQHAGGFDSRHRQRQRDQRHALLLGRKQHRVADRATRRARGTDAHRPHQRRLRRSHRK
ncbi:MAG: hypothetical protein E6I06_04815 [Chloroflexi bacterium]|nr:MAG: hypothetical protein E6I06_04815 [Chloroflexota bacterium]